MHLPGPQVPGPPAKVGRDTPHAPGPARGVVPADELARALAYAREQLSPATRRAYRADMRIFEVWCAARGLAALPASAETASSFLADEAASGRAVSTVMRRAAAIRYAHMLAGAEPPTGSPLVTATLGGIRNVHKTAPRRRRAAGAELVKAMAARCPSTRRGLRDRAVVLLGFAGAFRRSELAALDCSDIAEEADGLRVTIRSSKTDREGRGVELAIPRGGVCPVGAVALWRQAAGIETGPLFRPIDRWGRLGGAALSPHAMGDIVKRLAEACGEDPEGFGGHSLRAGWITEAAGLGREPFAIAGHARQAIATTQGYVRRERAFDGHAGEGML